MNTSRDMTPAQFCYWANITPDTFTRMVTARTIRTVKRGYGIVVPWDFAMEWLRAVEKQTGQVFRVPGHPEIPRHELKAAAARIPEHKTHRFDLPNAAGPDDPLVKAAMDAIAKAQKHGSSG